MDKAKLGECLMQNMNNKTCLYHREYICSKGNGARLLRQSGKNTRASPERGFRRSEVTGSVKEQETRKNRTVMVLPSSSNL